MENYDSRIALEEWNGATDADPFDDVRPPAGAVLDQIADALDDTGRATLTLVRNLGDLAFKRNGTLNVNRVAAMTGVPQRTLARRVNRMKGLAVWN